MSKKRRYLVTRLMLFVMFLSTILPLSLAVNTSKASAAEAGQKKVLLVTITTGYRHASAEDAKTVLPQMGTKYGFQVDETEKAADINAANLAKYDVVFFANTTGNFKDWGLSDQQLKDLMAFIKSGKGFVGAHAATDTGYDSAEYGQMTGAYFNNHPWTQKVTFNVEDQNNPATAHLGAAWKDKLEEVYYFKSNPRDAGKHILLSLDMNSVGGSPLEDHPNAWCSPVEQGRMFYTALGHHPETWHDPVYQQHLLGGLQYAWGEAKNTDCDKSSVKPGLQKVSITKSIQLPVGLDVASNGTIFAISLAGKAYQVSQEGDTKEILNIPTTMEGEHGLMGIALDPAFDTNHYIYLYYTNPVKENGKLINNLSRYTYENGVLNPASEKILLKETSDPICCHQAGFLKFGPDGKLYLTAGDNNLPTQGPQVNSIKTSQNLDDMRGKILRMNSDGTAPTDNPFYEGKGGARDYVYAYGFRNPYRISFEQKADKMVIYEGDVGPDGTFAGGANGDFDEFNAVTAPGQNFGWPYGIGDKVYNKTDYPNATFVNQIDDAVFAEKFAQTKKPIAFYPYTAKAPFGQGGRTAMAGPVYNYTGPNAIPNLNGKFLAYDFTRNWIKAITTDKNGEVVKIDDFLSGLLAPIDMKLGPDGALYIAEFGSSWGVDPNEGITKIFYGKLERKPVVQAKVSATSGKTPLTVNFDTTGTMDPDNDAITYAWAFGDGGTSTEANPSHTFTANGSYVVTLTVTDSTGKSAVWNTTIIVGNTVPQIHITSPQNGLFFTNGQTVTATVYATDEEDGTLACENIKWSVSLIHDDHYHPMTPATGCNPQFLLLDNGHGPEARISWNLKAEVTDNGATGSAPLTASDSITFRNKRVQAEEFNATGGGAPTAEADWGVKTEDTGDTYGGKNVGFTEANDWMMFKNIDMSTINKMYFRMASDSKLLNLEVHLDSPDGQKVAAVSSATTKGWQNWTTISSDVTYAPKAAGTVTDAVYTDMHDVYLKFPTGGNNVNWVQFASAGDKAPTEADKCNTNCVGMPKLPDVSGALNRTGWKASASHEGTTDKAANGIDGKQDTRWTTSTGAAPDMWYQVDMGTVQKISRVVVDHGSQWTAADLPKHPDYFRGYDLLVSTDGQTWTKVASKDTSWKNLVVDEKFAPVNARYIKMVNKGADSAWWLSIHEFYAFAADPRLDWTFTTSPRAGGDDSANPSDVKNVVDGKMNTRWDSGGNQKAGDWFQVNMGAVKTINEVIIDATGHSADSARGYIIEVSKDGKSWKQMAVNANNTAVKIDAKFNPVKAQYVKITQTGSSDANWWSIDELDIKETNLPAIELDAVLTADNAGRILNAGDQVKVTVSATDAEKLFAGKLLVNYDSSKFTYVSSSINQQFGKEGETAFMVAKVENGKLSYALTSLGDAPGKDGNVGLIDIIFTVNADGAASLSKASEYADVNGTLVMLNADRGISIALSNADVNGDNKINSGDLVDVAKAFGKATFNPKFDVNHDGKINIEDIAFVARKLLEM